ncbi:MAG: hypothetical protein WAX79_04695, partial [Candidatus Omnitrophota bacterium]
ETTSQSNVFSSSMLTDKSYIGGGKKMTLSENTSISADSTTKDTGNSPTNPDTSTFIPAETGQFDNLVRPEDTDFIDPGDKRNVDPDTESEGKISAEKAYLERERDRFTATAVLLDEIAQTYKVKAEKLNREASEIICGWFCFRRSRLRAEAAQMTQVATVLQNQANAARSEAALIGQKISSL